MRFAPASRGLVAAALLALPALATAQSIELGDGQLGIHGYLTQGYAASDGVPFMGIRDGGSTDFRYAALQFRYDRGQDGFLVQVNHRRLGRSPITEFESSMNLNWAFYERRSESGTTALKVGRIPVPRGIYNEHRNVGVILPFYRVPVIFYDEAAYYSETIDGAVVRHSFAPGARWGLDASVYGGGWSLLQYDQFSDEYAIGRVRAENAVGTQLWLRTPIQGVRLGASAQRYDWTSVDQGIDQDRQDVWEAQLSLDAMLPRVMLRAESMLQNYEIDDYYANYVQVGVQPVSRLWVYGQGEYAYERNATYLDGGPRDFDWHRAAGAGLAFHLTPQFVLKAEHHWNRGVQVEQTVADVMAPPSFRYFILSASASF